MYRVIPLLSSSSTLVHRGLTQLSSVSEAFSSSLLSSRVEVQGWVDSRQVMGKELAFLHLRDGLGCQRLQIVINDLDLIKDVSYHCAVVIRGLLESSLRSEVQSVELRADHVEVIGPNVDITKENNEAKGRHGYPLKSKKQTLDVCRRYPMYRGKLASFQAMLRSKNALKFALHEHLQKEGFVHIDVPIITSIDNFESHQDNEEEEEHNQQQVFGVVSKPLRSGEDPYTCYFDKKVHLSTSGQLHLEAMSNGMNRVYSFTPAFRAERSNTRTHLAEFTMLEAEMAFCDDQNILISHIERLIKTSVSKMVDRCRKEFDLIVSDERKEHVFKLINEPFSVLTYEEALKALNERDRSKHVFVHEVEEGCDFGREHEIFLAQHFCNGHPVFITEWPRHLKPFYAAGLKHKRDHVAAIDLLLPYVGEVCGGSLRESSFDTLQSNLKGVKASLQWYVDMRRRGAAPMAGFGLGIERLTQLVLNVNHIKDTLPFPRTPHNCIL